MTAPWPDRVLIGHLWFKLIGFTAAERHKFGLDSGDEGWCDYDGQRLFYYAEQSIPNQADALLHEIGHALHRYYGLVDQHFEFGPGVCAERVNRLTVTGLCCVFSANAEFRRAWMAAVSPNTKTPFPQLT